MIGSPKELVPRFFDKTALTYDWVVNWTTLGNDRYWKDEILKRIPPCESVLDLACGTAILTLKIREKLPHARIIGVDLTGSYLSVAREKVKPHHRISLIHQDAEKLLLRLKFDCITSSYIPKYCKAETLIKTCMDHLNPGGRIILHDFTHPRGFFIQRGWEIYFLFLKLAGYFIPGWKDVFMELPRLIRRTRWVDEFERVLLENGFEVERKSLSLGTAAILSATKPG